MALAYAALYWSCVLIDNDTLNWDLYKYVLEKYMVNERWNLPAMTSPENRGHPRISSRSKNFLIRTNVMVSSPKSKASMKAGILQPSGGGAHSAGMFWSCDAWRAQIVFQCIERVRTNHFWSGAANMWSVANWQAY
jgi:hypothetical protein